MKEFTLIVIIVVCILFLLALITKLRTERLYAKLVSANNETITVQQELKRALTRENQHIDRLEELVNINKNLNNQLTACRKQ